MTHTTTANQATIMRHPATLTSFTPGPTEVQAERSRLRREPAATALAPARHARMDVGEATTAALTALEDATIAASVAVERAFSLAAVLDEALAVLADAAGTRPARSPAQDLAPGVAALSPREHQVLALVAEGCTNKVIAQRLFVSSNTIKTHVASLLTKLQADSRAELAAMAVRHGLG